MLYLDHDLKASLSVSTPIFDQLMTLPGKIYRQMDGRTTRRVDLAGNSFFIKQHQGVGWQEIIKNLLQLKWPVISAKNEWRAIRALDKLKINVPKVYAYGERGWNPGHKQSFVLLEDLKNTISLEDLTRDWKIKPPSISLKDKLIKEIARIARLMHQHHICHRDFYLCHFLLDINNRKLYLIDLHRAQSNYFLSERWIIKDLAGLYFSSKNGGLSHRDFMRFIKYYRDDSLRCILKQEKHFWLKVKERGERLYREHC